MTSLQLTSLLDAKLALEYELIMPLATIGRQYIAAWAENGGGLSTVDREVFKLRLEQVFRRHYARTVSVMIGRRPGRKTTLSEAALSLVHLESLGSRARVQAALLFAGIDQDLAAARAGSIMLPTDGTENFGKGVVPPGEIGVQLETKDKVRGVTAGYVLKVTDWAKAATAKLKAKLGLTANVNTNGVAEEARFIYADGKSDGFVMHTWHNCQDARVRQPPRSRFDHVSPEGQTSPIREPFIVSGELLRFPGDMSLGASIGNIANCRCWATYTMRMPDGSEVYIDQLPSAPTRRVYLPTDRPGVGSRQYNPTTTVTLNGRTRATVILGDGSPARLLQVEPGLVNIRVRGQTVARARFSGSEITELSISPEFRGGTFDIEGLIRRSVTHSAGR